MKRLILLELILLFLATTFMTDSTPGWVQQTLPRTDNIIQDIYFLDSLNGWSAAVKYPSLDTGFVFKTTNGGINWINIWQQKTYIFQLQFIDNSTGYIAGSSGSGTGRIYKTSNGGINWNLILSAGNEFTDLFFINKDTGWVYDDDGTFGTGLLKTTNGGAGWTQQLQNTSVPSKLFFINKDTGWVTCQSTKLLKTTDSGLNWNQIYVFSGVLGPSLFFTNRDTGFIVNSGANAVQRTTNGGFNWTSTINSMGGRCIYFINNSYGWLCDVQSILQKTTNGGASWFSQTTPLFTNNSIMFVDSTKGWVGGNGVAHTTDGGGPPVGIHQIGNEVPAEYKLFQNYPNPFNPNTNIKYELKVQKFVKLKVFDISGKEVTTLVNRKQNAGTYEVDFDDGNLPSGVYFYQLTVDGTVMDTKKMILIK